MSDLAATLDLGSDQACVVADYGKHTLVRYQGVVQPAAPRRKNLRPVVGDVVQVEFDSTAQTLWISAQTPRRNALYRADATKQKCFAANVDTVFLMLAPQPAPLLDLLARTLVACHAAGLPLHIVLNKADLPEFSRMQPLQAMLAAADIPCTAVAARAQPAQAVEVLTPYLIGKRSVIIGQSGVGKSSLVNALVPDLSIQVQALSRATQTGRHTTTTSQLYLADGFEVIDSPGFQNFGLTHVPPHQWIESFTTLTPHIEHCRFYNCTHLHEPGCGVIGALGEGENRAWYQLLLGMHHGPRA